MNSQANRGFRAEILIKHGTMSIVLVSKSMPAVVAGPCAGIVHRSSFDRCIPPVPVTLLLVFDQPIHDPVETIKKALSQALMHYPPMAGRLASTGDDDGELHHIACTGEGVSFVAASAGCALDDEATRSALLLGDLAVGYPAEYCRLSDPFLLMQVTEFSCGGFVVGVSWNHVVADAAGMAQFLGPSASSPGGCRRRPSLRSECAGDCTVFEAVAAVLWRCRTRAVISDAGPDDPAVAFAFPSNVRGLVGAKEGYYGNCVTMQQVQATGAAVASGDVKDLVKLIKLAKDKVSDILVVNAGDETGVVGGGRDEQQLAPPCSRYNTLIVTSWRNLGFEAVDFGRGAAARVMWKPHRTVGFVGVVCPPCKGDDGVNVVSFCVKPEHAAAFVAESAALNI
ncbi:hypothetical protein ZWY2020_000825 [Hordeum vulgare]|nr:hypothetical protein ZWY2020_000825 [Hordeum vulgare]